MTWSDCLAAGDAEWSGCKVPGVAEWSGCAAPEEAEWILEEVGEAEDDTEFSSEFDEEEHTVGEFPEEWEFIVNQNSDGVLWGIEEGFDSLFGGRVLRRFSDTQGSRKQAVAPKVEILRASEDDEPVEIAGRLRWTGGNPTIFQDRNGLIIRARQLPDGVFEGITLCSRNQGVAPFRVAEYLEGGTVSGETIASFSGFSHPSSTYFGYRLRAEENLVYARVWNWIDPEPEIWNVANGVITQITQGGRSGPFSNWGGNNQEHDNDVIGIVVGGGIVQLPS